MNATLEAMMANFNSYKNRSVKKVTKTEARPAANREALFAKLQAIEARIGGVA